MEAKAQTEPSQEQIDAEFQKIIAELPHDDQGRIVGADGKPLQSGLYQLPDGTQFKIQSPQAQETAPQAPAPAEQPVPEQPAVQPPAPAAETPVEQEQQSTFGRMHNEVVNAFKEQGILPNPDPAHGANAGITDAMSKLLTVQLANSVYQDEGPGLLRASADVVNTINQRRAEAGMEAVAPEAVLGAVDAGIEKAVSAKTGQQVLDGQAPAEAINAIPQTPAAQNAPEQQASWATKMQQQQALASAQGIAK